MCRKVIVGISIIGVLFVFLSGCAGMGEPAGEAEKRLNIRIATNATWPPMESVDEEGNLVGFDIDLMQAVAEAGGFTYEFVNIAWDGIFDGLQTGKYDAVMSAVSITDERMQTMDFSVPYYNAGQVLVVKRLWFIFDWFDGRNSIEHFINQTIGALIDSTGAEAVQTVSDVNLKTYQKIEDAFTDCFSEEIQAVMADGPTAGVFVKDTAYENTLKVIGAPFTEEHYGIAVKKGNAQILQAIDRGLSRVLESDTYNEIVNEWLH